MNTDIPILTIGASASPSVSVERLADGSRRIRNDSGSITVPHTSILALRLKLLELDRIPRLWPAEFTLVPIDNDVGCYVCSDGTVIIEAWREWPHATVQIETEELGRLARALS